MKGLCDDDAAKEGHYDREYYIYGQRNGKPYFRYPMYPNSQKKAVIRSLS